MTRVCLGLLAVLVLCALSLVTSRHQARRAFVELERQQARAHQYDVEYGQLSLEASTWGMPARVAQIARDNLRMELPTPSRVEVVDLPPTAPVGSAPHASSPVIAAAGRSAR
ncbi:MAG: cell division protein FtsL [Proteobacteria bacterium]|jgi:cell division protein FtsL|nr:cell division protein FtsL [Pseudomonadota bacterium]